jgi:hypothetical protein
MKTTLCSVALLALLSACASGNRNSGPAVDLQIAPINLSSNLLYFRGTVPLEFAVRVTNPTDETVKMQSLDLATVGPGAFRLRSGIVPVNRTIPPGGTTDLTVQTWGFASGGFMRAEEPVTIRANGTFRAGGHSFIRMRNEVISP